jgi:hypothetical protein
MLYLTCPKRLYEFAEQCLDYLDFGNISGDIYIHTNKNLKWEHGLAWGDREMVEIELSTHPACTKSIFDLRTTLAHELVHARQYLTGQMRVYTNSPITVFKGRKYQHNRYRIDERNSPWEKEAYRLEKEIMDLLYPGKYL